MMKIKIFDLTKPFVVRIFMLLLSNLFPSFLPIRLLIALKTLCVITVYIPYIQLKIQFVKSFFQKISNFAFEQDSIEEIQDIKLAFFSFSMGSS